MKENMFSKKYVFGEGCLVTQWISKYFFKYELQAVQAAEF